MVDIYTLLENGRNYSIGYSDLSFCNEKILRPEGCTVLVCVSGSATISVNTERHDFRGHRMLVVFSGFAMSVSDISDDFNVFYCAVSDNMMYEASNDIPWDFFDRCRLNPVFTLNNEQYDILTTWRRQLEWIRDLSKEEQTVLMRNSIQNLFQTINIIIGQQDVTQNKRSRMLFDRFYDLVVKHCNKERKASYYADRMCISTYYLRLITAREVGQTPKEIIDRKVILIMKMYLSKTDLSIKEIAERLNFPDPAYMNRFFKSAIKISMTQYRAQFK